MAPGAGRDHALQLPLGARLSEPFDDERGEFCALRAARGLLGVPGHPVGEARDRVDQGDTGDPGGFEEPGQGGFNGRCHFPVSPFTSERRTVL